MDRFVERCAGLDVHKDSVAATVHVPGRAGSRLQETRTFATTTRGLLTLADWLASYGVSLVGMYEIVVSSKPEDRKVSGLRLFSRDHSEAPAGVAVWWKRDK